jgi:NitT/TauT family transport system substrate-binding protein
VSGATSLADAVANNARGKSRPWEDKMLRVAMVVATWALVSAPVTLEAEPAQPLKRLELGIGGRTLFSYLPLTLTERLGYFRDQGLEVKVNDFQGGSKSLEALVGGSVDIVAAAYENTLFLQAKGIELKAVGLLTDRFGLVFGLTKQLAASYKSPKDLKGLKIGVTAPGSAVSNALDIILAKDGLSVKDVSVIGVGTGSGAIAAMKSGQIDGLVLSDPAITRLETDGAIVAVVDSRTEEGQKYLYGGPNANSSILIRAQFAREEPAIVQAFVNAFVRTMKWMQKSNLDDMIAVIPPDYFGSDKELYKKALAANLAGFTRDGELTLALAETTYRSVAGSGRLAGSVKLDIARTIEESFWQKAAVR